MYHDQPWVAQTVDESEDDEVQGIFGRQGLPGPAANATAAPGAGMLGERQGQHLGGASQVEYDDMVHRFSGLMGQNVFGGDGSSFLDAPPASQLNANVAAFTPGGQNQEMFYQQQLLLLQQQQQQQQHPRMGQGAGHNHPPQHANWHEAVRTKHRTPGPHENAGPSPPNPFRYGLGFNYPPGKTGLTPTNFTEDPQPFANPYGVPLYGSSQGTIAGTMQQQQASAWYEQLPQGQTLPPNNFGEDGDAGCDFDYSGASTIRSLDFSAPFLQSEELGAPPGIAQDRQQQQHQQRMHGGPPGMGMPGMPQPLYGFHGGPSQGMAGGSPNGGFQGFVGVNHAADLPGGGVYGHVSSSHFPQSPYGRFSDEHTRSGLGDEHEGSSALHSRMGGPPAGFQVQMKPPVSEYVDEEQTPPHSAAVQSQPLGYGDYARATHATSANRGAGLANYAKAASQGSQPPAQREAVLRNEAGSSAANANVNPYYRDSRQPLANTNQRAGRTGGLASMNEEEGVEEERKDVGRDAGTASKTGSQSRPVSHSIDSQRSSASGSQESQASREAFANKKRQELEESPHTRGVFKDFYKTFRSREKDGYEAAFAYAQQALNSKDVPERIHWKIYLEMADLAKRENRFPEARRLYQLVNQTQPFAHQGWLEYSKMEEECGRLHQCRLILHQGLEFCNYAEQLLTKAIKHEERMGNLQRARALLARLRNQSVDKTWRTILEGALLEARAGNIVVARKVFKYLMQHVPWYGPIYYEATKFEEKNEEFERAIAIVEKGLKEIPRYGPLWFNAFRLHEKTEMEAALREALASAPQALPTIDLLRSDAPASIDLFEMFGVRGDEFHTAPLYCPLLRTRGALQRAMNCISKELVWKVHFEAAQVAERGGGPGALERARHAYVQSILRCPVNLRWKVWLAGARAELAHNHIDKARQLLDRALIDVPAKSKAQVLLECSRLEEYTGNLDEARAILANAREETRHEWKVFLESVMLEVRNGQREDAIRAAEDALAIHSGTGRLWAILVQLKHVHGPDAQRLVFREALKQVPKSGEVWCEGARIHMHPLSPHLDLDTARRYLQFAIQFTPQYGDSFIIALRWQLLFANFGHGRLAESATEDLDEEEFRANMLKCDTTDLELKCVNADPNYGSLWFHCKRGPFDTARQVLRTAKRLLVAELTKFRYVYRDAILDAMRRKREGADRPRARTKARTTPALASGENTWITERLQGFPGAEGYCDFSSGLLCVNWLRENVSLLVDAERRKFLFGSDQIVP